LPACFARNTGGLSISSFESATHTGEQIGHLRDRSGTISERAGRTRACNHGPVLKQLWQMLSLQVVRGLIAKDIKVGSSIPASIAKSNCARFRPQNLARLSRRKSPCTYFCTCDSESLNRTRGLEAGSDANAARIQRGLVRCRYRWCLLRRRPAWCRNAGGSRAQNACSRESHRRRQYR
jgi:hypothetical protein